jgi:hypothetical protein
MFGPVLPEIAGIVPMPLQRQIAVSKVSRLLSKPTLLFVFLHPLPALLPMAHCLLLPSARSRPKSLSTDLADFLMGHGLSSSFLR